MEDKFQFPSYIHTHNIIFLCDYERIPPDGGGFGATLIPRPPLRVLPAYLPARLLTCRSGTLWVKLNNSGTLQYKQRASEPHSRIFKLLCQKLTLLVTVLFWVNSF